MFKFTCGNIMDNSMDNSSGGGGRHNNNPSKLLVIPGGKVVAYWAVIVFGQAARPKGR